MSDTYLKRGVSSSKEDVHAAISNLSVGLFPKMFCKVFPDYLANDDDYVSLMSSDGSGTKSILAYLYWKETGDVSVWAGIAQDALVMNLDDMIAVGATGPFLYSSVINRNKNRIPGEVISAIIQGTQWCIDKLRENGVNITLTGGETADLGDIVRTVTIDGSMISRMKKDDLIYTHNIKPGQVIVGLASFGKANYEDEYNSGIGSNGLTGARHDILSKYYAKTYPETYEPQIDENVVYIGRHRMTDPASNGLNIGKSLLSPTRSFAPVMIPVLKEYKNDIHSIVHNTGGGHHKVAHFADNVRIIKDQLFEPPYIFQEIEKSSGSSHEEMHKVYNMGTRMELYIDESAAAGIIEISKSYGVNAKIIGRVEANDRLEIILK
jgi:phosphoribosylformylglycinamidine cyclo-ligase